LCSLVLMIQAVKIEVGENLKLSSGEYFIEKEVGKGGFGSVYKATKGGVDYAIKINRLWELLPEDRDEIRKRVKQEFEISHSIRSSHIVLTHAIDEIGENPVLIMDFCPDGSLRERISKPHSREELIDLGIQILSGLNILHSYGIIHRDIKPENILFKKDIALLTDFGISANLRNRLTVTDVKGNAVKIFATLSYSPPEQAQRALAYKQTGSTNDIFSFGVIMYELITKGHLPFGDIKDFNKDSKIIENKKKKGEWDIQTLIRCNVEDFWQMLIQDCLNPDPEKRFKTTDEMIKILMSHRSTSPMESACWKIYVMNDPENIKIFNLTNLARNKNRHSLTIGRYDENDPYINDIALNERSTNFISLHHGTLEYITNGNHTSWYLRDGQWFERCGIKGWYPSRNGIEVNSVKIGSEGVMLNANDTIKIGRTILCIRCE
jgi:serine/threonine protein kinase